MLTDHDAFKVGFLSRCVEAGLSPEQMLATVKQASDMLEKQAILGAVTGLLDKGWDAAKGLGGLALHYGVPAAVLAPPVVGGLAGYGLAHTTDISDTDVAEIKDKEIVDEYQRQTQRLKRLKAMRDAAKHQQRPTRNLI